MENNKNAVPASAGGVPGGTRQKNSPLVEEYRDEIRRAVVNAVKSTRSCVLFYSDIYYELEKVVEDEDTFRRVENALWEFIDGLRLGDVALHKIYADPDESFHEVVVVDFGGRLSEEQLRILREVAALFGTDFYDRYGEADGVFYDAMPLYHRDRYEIYTTLHNLVRMWTGCGGDQD
jgi:hypothetical protein